MSYEQQLQEKQTYVRKNIGDYCKVLPIIGMENPYHYRNKVHAVFDVERRENMQTEADVPQETDMQRRHRAA